MTSSGYGARPRLGVAEVRIVAAAGDERALAAAKGDPAGWFKNRRSGAFAQVTSREKETRRHLRGNGTDPLDSEFEDSEDGEGEGVDAAGVAGGAGAGAAAAVDSASPAVPETPSGTSPPAGRSEELFGSRVSALVVFEGRSERVASCFEHRTFDVTEPTAELRVLLFGEGALGLDEAFLGAAVLPIQNVLDSENGRFDGWLDAFGPSKENTERDLRDPEYRIRLLPTRNRRGWRGKIRIQVSLRADAPFYRWYLRQPAREAGRGGGDCTPRVDDTVGGVLISLERIVTAALSPATASIAALGHVMSPHDRWLPRLWGLWHTFGCFVAGKRALGSYALLWFVSGCVFTGYAAARARALDSPAELYHGPRVVMSLKSASSFGRLNGVAGVAGVDSDIARGGSETASGSALERFSVGGFANASDTEKRRLRVQRWLKEHRIRRKKASLALQRDVREEALRARLKSPREGIASARRADLVAVGEKNRFLTAWNGNATGNRVIGNRTETETDFDSSDSDEPFQWVLRRVRLQKLADLVSSANPAEIALRVLQQITWTLLTTLQSAGATLINVTASFGRVRRMLAGPCRKICEILDPIADTLERLGGVLSWRDERLSNYVAVTLIAAAAALCASIQVVVVPVGLFLDSHSPIRARHLAWIVGISPCLGDIKIVNRTCVKMCVLCERVVQNLLGALRVAPISPYTLELLERALEEEFEANGGTWEGIESMYLAIEKKNAEKLEAREAAANALLRDELRRGIGLNPLRWLAHATRRAPTRVDYEHGRLVRRLVAKNE